MPTITPFLWFDTQAEEAMNFYASVFSRSKVISVNRAQGKVMSVQFELEGQEFMALNAGPQFTFTEAISFFVGCETQQEIDELWAKLTADGGAPSRCGWLKDKFGLSWQIIPNALGADAERQGRREVEAGHECHAPDGEARSEAVAAGVSTGSDCRARRSESPPLRLSWSQSFSVRRFAFFLFGPGFAFRWARASCRPFEARRPTVRTLPEASR